MSTPIEFRPGAERYRTDLGWLQSWHSFSFGEYHDPTNRGHGQLLVSNDDMVQGGGGFGTHAHRDMEIVTWVLSGELEHRDSEGNHGVLYPGLAQRMSAGRGIRHSEMNASTENAVHFIQMWVIPDVTGIDPGYEQRDLNQALADGGLVPLASGQGHDGAVAIHQAGAVLWGARLAVGGSITVPDGAHVHVFVATGSATCGDREMVAGDAVRLVDAGEMSLTAHDEAAEILVWVTA